MKLPEGMTAATWDRISKLPTHKRDRVLERACILHFEAGVPFPAADEQALAAEGVHTQQRIGGV